MAVHLLKLCVGVESLADLQKRVAERVQNSRRAGEPDQAQHITRMTPKRIDELLDGGSLYWVIKGEIAARQELTDVKSFVDAEGTPRCRLALAPMVRPVRPRACRPFQGWRYLAAHEAPPDLDAPNALGADLPDALRQDLRRLGLL